jgi:hypothetical protein
MVQYFPDEEPLHYMSCSAANLDYYLTRIPKPTWVVDKFLMAENVTVLTSLWKNGKSTLIADLIRCLCRGEPFLGLPCRASRVHLISEERFGLWHDRIGAWSLGQRLRIWQQPQLNFASGPGSLQHFFEDVSDEFYRTQNRRPDDGLQSLPKVVIVDPLSAILAPGTENDPQVIVKLFEQIDRYFPLATVIIVHHPPKNASPYAPGGRGSSLLSTLPSTLIDVKPFSPNPVDAFRRRLIVRSRFPTISELAYEYDPATRTHRRIDDTTVEYEVRNVEWLLARHPNGLTIPAMIDRWPTKPAPHRGTLARQLTLALADGRIEKSGAGSRYEPFVFRPRRSVATDGPHAP